MVSFPTRRWVAILGCLGVGLLACYRWAPTTPPAVASAPRDTLTQFRVTTQGGVIRRFTRVHLRNDSLLGTQVSTNRPRVPGVAVTDITQIEVRRIDPGRTLLVVGAVGLMTVSAMVLLTSDLDPNWGSVGGLAAPRTGP